MKKINVAAFTVAVIAGFIYVPLYHATTRGEPAWYGIPFFALLLGGGLWAILFAGLVIWKGIQFATHKRTRDAARGAYRMASQRARRTMDRLEEEGRN
jgi:hypothetical protein